jgi:cyclopropane fatty-acyl-phospholipid synthase-like methyltransferase
MPTRIPDGLHASRTRGASSVEIQRRNRELYDRVDGAIWRLAVYEPLFGGARYINMGGEHLARRLVDLLGITEGDPVLDIGCGTGDFARRIAALSGAHITGIEMNPWQAERARVAAQDCQHGRLTIVEADAARWVSASRFRAAYSVDTLMLIADWSRLLRTVRGAMSRPDGAFIATVILDQGLDHAEHRYFWEQDGFISLPRRESAARAYIASGLPRLRWEAHNEWAMQTLGGITQSLVERRPAIEDAIGGEAWREWVEVNSAYLAAFRRGKLSYELVEAKPR